MKKIYIVLIFASICMLLVSLSGCTPKQEVTVYFAAEEDADFFLKAQTIEVDPSPDPYQASLNALIEGPETDTLFATLPSNTSVYAVSIENGLAIADFSKELLTDTSIPRSSTTETLAIFSIVNTLTEFDEIQKVRITIEGQQTGEIEGHYIEDFWGHIGLGQDFTRNQNIIIENDS